MAHSRPRQAAARASYAESDSGGDTEREQTPRPAASRTHSKRRLSERVDPDGSFSLDNSPAGAPPAAGRAPLANVNINDDVAEKRRRRKSAKVVVTLDPDEDQDAGPSLLPNGGGPSEGAAEASRGANLARQKSQLLSVPQAPVINVPMDVMTSNFDQWMKMATDNVSLTFLFCPPYTLQEPPHYTLPKPVVLS